MNLYPSVTCLRALGVSLLASLSLAGPLIANRPAPTATYAEVSPHYERTMLPSGRYEVETYAFGKGMLLDASENDASLNRLSFREMGQILSTALAEADYQPTPSPEETDLLILVSWGKTIPQSLSIEGLALDNMSSTLSMISSLIVKRENSNSWQKNFSRSSSGNLSPDKSELTSAETSMITMAELEMQQGLMLQKMERDARAEANAYNARLLGYTPELYYTNNILGVDGPLRTYRNDLIDELESPRYFVILQAYDFQKLWKHKERDLLWTTRFSIRAKGRSFDEELLNMALASSRLFGEESKRLNRHLTRERVEIGELEFLGSEP